MKALKIFAIAAICSMALVGCCKKCCNGENTECCDSTAVVVDSCCAHKCCGDSACCEHKCCGDSAACAHACCGDSAAHTCCHAEAAAE